MRRFITREAFLIVPLVLAATAVTFALRDNGPVSSPERAIDAGSSSAVGDPVQQGLHVSPWKAGQYRVEDQGVGLTVIAVRLNPERTTILYTVDSEATAANPAATSVRVTDDTGVAYSTISDATIGSWRGIAAHVLTVEAIRPETRGLQLEVAEVSGIDSPDHRLQGSWTVRFINMVQPGTPSYDSGGRVAPEIISLGGDTKIALASGPGSAFIRLLVERGSEQSKLFGYAPEGVARAVTESEWNQLFKEEYLYDDPGLPSGWEMDSQ